MSTLIERLNARAHDPDRATDEKREGAGGKAIISVAAPPAGEAQIAAAETTLGVRLPDLLRQVYQEVGNGGFGPGYGLPGVPTSTSEREASVVGRYAALQQAAGRRAWPIGLLPLCEWGGNVVSFLDCSRPDTPIIRLDPNMPKADVPQRVPAARQYDRAGQISPACWVESPSLEVWLEAWADGKPLFYMAYGSGDGGDAEDDEDEEGDDAV